MMLFNVELTNKSFCNIDLSGAACTFPDELRGTWVSSHKGALSFNDSLITEYPIQMSAVVSALDFNCHESSGRTYLIK